MTLHQIQVLHRILTESRGYCCRGVIFIYSLLEVSMTRFLSVALVAALFIVAAGCDEASVPTMAGEEEGVAATSTSPTAAARHAQRARAARTAVV